MKNEVTIYDVIILLIDDDLNQLTKTRRLLKRQGFKNVIMCSSLEETIVMCKQLHKPYIIITECNISSHNICDIVLAIRSMCYDIKFIVLSGSEKLSDSFKSLELGAVSFIHKTEPNWDELLVDSLKTWLDYYTTRDLMIYRVQETMKKYEMAVI